MRHALRHRLRSRRLALGVFLCGLTAAAVCGADDYDDYAAFARANFGAEKEPLVYDMFGSVLGAVPGGDWVHASESSAAIAWETNLPALGTVEYGPTAAYGQATPCEDRHVFLHLHYLNGLLPDTTVHYRVGSTDERGNTVWSEDRTLITSTPAGVVRVPDDLPGSPPYALDRNDTTYLVTRDITAPGSVLNVSGDRVTVDLNGHVLTYDDTAGAPDAVPAGDWGWPAEQGPCGVRVLAYRTTRLVNGVVRQGLGGGPFTTPPWGFYPVYLRRPQLSEVAGITVEYQGNQVSGITVDSAYRTNVIHHNAVIDRGTAIDDRHRGLDGIYLDVEDAGGSLTCHHNLLLRVRHRGIRSGSNMEVYSNEIHLDSWATNSYGVMYYGGLFNIAVHDNRVFGTGYHPVGLGPGFTDAHDITVERNYIQMQGEAPSSYRWPGGPGDPTGQEHPVNGIRLHEGPQRNIDVGHNTIVVKARGTPAEGARMRGLWVTPLGAMENVVFHDNVVKQVAENEYADGHAVACLGATADAANPDTIVTYTANRIEANTCNVRFGDNYGSGGKHHFVENTFSRLGADPRYATIKFGWEGWNYESWGHTFLDSMFDGGASYDALTFESAVPAYDDFTVLWTLTVRTYPGAIMTVTDVGGATVYTATVAASGEVRVPLIEYLRTKQGKTYSTPHTVTLTNLCNEPRVYVVTMDQPRTLDVFGCAGNLFRNDETTALLPLSHAKADLFAHLRAGPPYMASATPGIEDPDTTVLTDAGRPLVLYELADTVAVLFVTATPVGALRLDW